MEIDIIKRETTGTGPNVYHENDTIAKYEIMDGAPVRGEQSGPSLLPAPPLGLLWVPWEPLEVSCPCTISQPDYPWKGL